MKTRLFATLTLTVASLSFACGGGSSQQKTAASEAIAALRKVEASTQVGVSYQQFGALAVDAKAKVNAAAAVLPDGELKNELNAAMDAYGDALAVWGDFIKRGRYIRYSDAPKLLEEKYSYKLRDMGDGYISQAESTKALSVIWEAARVHLDRASQLLGE